MTQPDLFSATRRDEMERAFHAFIAEHPEVWRLFVRFTLEKIDRRYEHYGAHAMLERVRWETDTGADAPDLKLNNNFAAFFAREFHRTYPQHDGFFRTRRQLSEGRCATGLPEPTRDSFA